ncbi:MAG: RNA polymerase factor sigma-54 [Chitinophagaceae bacterium]
MGLNQTQLQKQQQKILPQQIQLLNIFHLNDQQLNQLINDELLDNPLLEQNYNEPENEAEKNQKDEVQDYMGLDEYIYDDIPDYKTEYNNYVPSETPFPIAASGKTGFREDLKNQYRQQNEHESEYAVADYIIDSLNDNGMLDQDIDSICEYLSFSLKTWIEKKDVESILEKIQDLEPAGIGARNLQECLLLKLKRQNQKRPDIKKATCLVKDHFQELFAGNLENIRKSLEIDDEELKIILKLLASLKTRPLIENDNGINPSKYITPDFLITINEGEPEISLIRQRSGDLFINKSWIDSIQNTDTPHTEKETKQYVRNKLQSAQWFINAIKERETNMMKIMKCIVDLQHDYFQEGDIMQLKPMILKDVAERTNLDISTVSRVISNKYAETPFGTIFLKKLFSEGLPDKEGAIISNKVIQKIIEDIIENEDKKTPYTDQQIAGILTKRGYKIARRTVAKYREQLHIPMAMHRGLKAEIA